MDVATKKSLAEVHVNPVAHDTELGDHSLRSDDDVLTSLGYKAEFKREFGLWSTFCVSFAVLGLLPSFASTLYYGMGYAGTGGECSGHLCFGCELIIEFSGMVWGWLIAMVFIQCVAMSMAELCSAMPTSGGLYYASAVLAPPGWGPIAAWFTGWSNWISQITAAPSVNYGLCAMILASASIANPNYVPQNFHLFLLTSLVMIIHACISSMPTRWIANFNSYGTSINILALIIVLIIIPADTHNVPKFYPSSQVWGTIENGTDFPDGIAILMSFVAVM